MRFRVLSALPRLGFIGICFVFLSAHANKELTPEEKAWKYRDGVFKVIHWKFGNMIKAKQENNAAAFSKNANDMAILSRMLLEGFELKNSLPKGSLAKREIWQNWEDFSDRAQDFEMAIQTLAASGDVNAFEPRKFGRKHCGGCHRKYKEKH